MQLILFGNIVTPIITKKITFNIQGCKATIKNPKQRHYTKINTGEPMYPYSYICYLGTIVLRYNCKTKERAKKKLKQLILIEAIGRYTNEGLGRVKWTHGHIVNDETLVVPKQRMLRIRKGLPHDLTDNIKNLLRYALLHDFYHTNKHQSKIYVEPKLVDSKFMEKLRRHHEKNTEDKMIKTFQHYDRLSASITRKFRSPIRTRYNWKSRDDINFTKIAEEIMEVSDNPWKLYCLIHDNKDLDHVTESQKYGHTSLKKHLLIIANLIVQDFQKRRLE